MGELATVSGWGLTNESDRTSASSTLQYVSVPIINNKMCSNSYSSLIRIDPELQFCAGNDQGQDACAGDSGGPIVRYGKNKTDLLVGFYSISHIEFLFRKIEDRFTLIGVVSFGKGCGRAKYPGVYVKVKNFLTWINMEIQKERAERQESESKYALLNDKYREVFRVKYIEGINNIIYYFQRTPLSLCPPRQQREQRQKRRRQQQSPQPQQEVP